MLFIHFILPILLHLLFLPTLSSSSVQCLNKYTIIVFKLQELIIKNRLRLRLRLWFEEMQKLYSFFIFLNLNLNLSFRFLSAASATPRETNHLQFEPDRSTLQNYLELSPAISTAKTFFIYFEKCDGHHIANSKNYLSLLHNLKIEHTKSVPR